jgi:hypothetical protein
MFDGLHVIVMLDGFWPDLVAKKAFCVAQPLQPKRGAGETLPVYPVSVWF